MSRTIVVKNADFSTNKVDVIEFIEVIPCTAIALNKNIDSISTIGSTTTITPTLTPVDTTDSVIWTSSNNEVATVGGGTVTAIGCGTATITATCGTNHATCTVTVTNTLSFSHMLKIKAWYDSSDSAGRDCLRVEYNNGSTMYAGLYNTTNPTTYEVYNLSNGAITGHVYPIIFGKGATNVVATLPDTLKITMWFADSETICDYSAVSAGATFAKFIAGDSSATGGTEVAAGNRTMAIPQGADCAIFTLYKVNNGTMTEEDVALVNIKAT